jgi:hypothetical protein
MIAFDDGQNSFRFSEEDNAHRRRGFPVVQAGPLDRWGCSNGSYCLGSADL